jgi:hypothetical protein
MPGFAASIACEAVSLKIEIASTNKERWSRCGYIGNDGW